MPVNKKMLTLYAIGLTHNILVGHYMLFHMDFSKLKTPKLQDLHIYKYRFATTWNFAFQTIYYAIAIACELLTSKSSNNLLSLSANNLRRLQKFRGHFFAGIIFPKTLIIIIIFWSLFNLNENYIFPPGFEVIISSWLNHCLHTNILYLIVIEIIFGTLHIPSLKSILYITNICDCIYAAIYFQTHCQTGRWLYRIFYYLNATQKALFVIVCIMLSNSFAYIGAKLLNKKGANYVINSNMKKIL